MPILNKSDFFKANKKTNQAPAHDAEDFAAPLIQLAERINKHRGTTTPLTGETPQGYYDYNQTLTLGGRCFILSDILALVASYLVGEFFAVVFNAVRTITSPEGMSWVSTSNLQQILIFLSLGTMAILWLDTKGHYRQRLPHWEALGHFVSVALVGLVCGGFIQYAMKDSFSRLQLGLSWFLFGTFLLVGRIYTRRMLEKAGLWRINTIVIGTQKSAQAIARALGRERQMGYAIVSQISAQSLFHVTKASGWKQLLNSYEADHIFLALEGTEMENHQAAIKAMVRARVPYSIVPPWHGLPSSTLSTHHFMMHDVLVLHNTNRLRLPLLRFLKRSFDVLAAGAAVLALSPIFVVIAMQVRRDGGPAMFSQPRVGLNGKHFRCYKFRSMRIDAEDVLQHYLAANPEAAREWALYQKLKNDIRITKFGHFIRKTSMDELPQLLNVLKGDMSLVGPRPIMPGQEEFYAEDFSYYESVRPGITGPWQVSGRSKLTFKERVALEAWYARNWNLWMDIVIILKTFPTLLKKDTAF